MQTCADGVWNSLFADQNNDLAVALKAHSDLKLPRY